MRFLSYSLLFLAGAGCSGATTQLSSTAETKGAVAAAQGRGEIKGDPCATNGWYGDGECDTFCATTDTDCIPDNSGSPIYCAQFIEISDGRCTRPDRDPCRFQDPDCAVDGGGGQGTACALISEVPDGKCSRPASDPCRFQDPDCNGPTDPGNIDCDLREIRCETFAPVTCPDGQVPSVVNACYGPCVDRASCAPIACTAISEVPDGVCSRPANDPCRSQDPDCVSHDAGVVCAQYIEQPDGVCKRAADDPCIFQDPDCTAH